MAAMGHVAVPMGRTASNASWWSPRAVPTPEAGPSEVVPTLNEACTRVFSSTMSEDLEKGEEQHSRRSITLSQAVISIHTISTTSSLLLVIIAFVVWRLWFVNNIAAEFIPLVHPAKTISRGQWRANEVLHMDLMTSEYVLDEHGGVVADSVHKVSAQAEWDVILSSLKQYGCGSQDTLFVDASVIWVCRKMHGRNGENLTSLAIVHDEAAKVWTNTLIDPGAILRNQLLSRTPYVWIVCFVLFGLFGGLGLCANRVITRKLKAICTQATESMRELSDIGPRIIACSAGLAGRAPGTSIDSGPRTICPEVQEFDQIKDSLDCMSNSIRSFNKYVDPSVAHVLLRRSPELSMVEADVTVLFSDIADFTSITETLEPNKLLEVLGLYFEHMGAIIVDSKGTIGDFIGDGIMAWWNIPVALGRTHTLVALRAALKQQRELENLNAIFHRRGLPSLRMRMGLARGKVLAGNIGCNGRMKFGLVGDAVNLASRLEGLCKMYDASILVDKSIQQAPLVSSRMLLRPIDLVKVKGRTAVTELFQVVGLRGDEGMQRFCDDFEAIQDLYRKKDLEATMDRLSAYRSEWPLDQPAEILAQRCAENRKTVGEWSPVVVLNHK